MYWLAAEPECELGNVRLEWDDVKVGYVEVRRGIWRGKATNDEEQRTKPRTFAISAELRARLEESGSRADMSFHMERHALDCKQCAERHLISSAQDAAYEAGWLPQFQARQRDGDGRTSYTCCFASGSSGTR